MKKSILLLLTVAFKLCMAQQSNENQANNTNTQPQQKHDYVRCIDMEAQERMLEAKDPTRKARRDAAIKMMNDWIANQSVNRVAQVETQYTIPVVFHVVWNTAAEKISLAQIKTQIKVMNEDYNRLNSDTTKTPSAFKSVASSFHITFCLAQRDPNGNATTGVVYKQTSVSGFTNDDAVKCPSRGGDTIWDPNKYLNIWVCYMGGGLLGYSEFPTSPLDNTYGSVILYNAIGDSGNVMAPFNLGRTVTHEVGHLLNLHHPWGDDGGLCPSQPGGVDDGAADTPPEGNNKNDGFGDGTGPTFGCPTFPYTDNCSNTSPGIMFDNFMSYTNDNCMNIFTKDQYTIALATIAGPLSKLVTSNACTPVGINEVQFEQSVNVYPNPSNTGRFNVSVSLTNITHIQAQVFNVLGQLITSWSSDNLSNNTYDLDLSNQPNGLYFVKLYNNDFSTVKKIMINR